MTDSVSRKGLFGAPSVGPNGSDAGVSRRGFTLVHDVGAPGCRLARAGVYRGGRHGLLGLRERLGPYPRYDNTSRGSSSRVSADYWASSRDRRADRQVSRGVVEWRARVYEYPDGSVEGTFTPRLEFGGSGSPGVTAEAQEGDGRAGLSAMAKHERCIASSVSRAQGGVARFVRFHNLQRLLTFTNGSEGVGWPDRQTALDDVSAWLKTHGGLLGATPVLIVAEEGKHGERWHVHAAIRKGYFLPYSRIIASWTAFMVRRGWPVNARAKCHRWHAGDEEGKGANGFSSARVCAQYMAKYVGKSFSGDAEYVKNQRRYRVSGGERPKPARYVGRSLTALCALVGVSSRDLRAVVQTIGYVDDVPVGVFRCWRFDARARCIPFRAVRPVLRMYRVARWVAGVGPWPYWCDGGADLRRLLRVVGASNETRHA